MCRNVDLETILATDLSQLGQVPKLQALALSALRGHLLTKLERLLAVLQPAGTSGRGGGAVSKGKGQAGDLDDDDVSQRSFILDGSPKSTRPHELPPYELSPRALQLQCLETGPQRQGPSPTSLHDSMVRGNRCHQQARLSVLVLWPEAFVQSL
jgi:hypothetical protein